MYLFIPGQEKTNQVQIEAANREIESHLAVIKTQRETIAQLEQMLRDCMKTRGN